MTMECILTALIAFTINYSLADIYAKKHHYKINGTQELLACGASNVFSSFFSCFTGGASLARSSVQDSAGGKTQVYFLSFFSRFKIKIVNYLKIKLVSIISSGLLCVVLLAISPLFEQLPQVKFIINMF